MEDLKRILLVKGNSCKKTLNYFSLARTSLETNRNNNQATMMLVIDARHFLHHFHVLLQQDSQQTCDCT